MPIISEAASIIDPLAGYERYAEGNWDCYGADPISPETVQAARRLLEMLPDTLGQPHVSPGADGTIGLEWVFTEGPLRKLYIDVGPAESGAAIGAAHPGRGAPSRRSPSMRRLKRSLPICSKT